MSRLGFHSRLYQRFKQWLETSPRIARPLVYGSQALFIPPLTQPGFTLILFKQFSKTTRVGVSFKVIKTKGFNGLTSSICTTDFHTKYLETGLNHHACLTAIPTSIQVPILMPEAPKMVQNSTFLSLALSTVKTTRLACQISGAKSRKWPAFWPQYPKTYQWKK